MDGISRAQAALISAQKISKKAVKVGFEWPNEETLYECIMSEFDEFKEDFISSNSGNIGWFGKGFLIIFSFL